MAKHWPNQAVITDPTTGDPVEVNVDNELQVDIVNKEVLTILAEIKCLMADNNKLLEDIREHLEIVTDEEIN